MPIMFNPPCPCCLPPDNEGPTNCVMIVEAAKSGINSYYQSQGIQADRVLIADDGTLGAPDTVAMDVHHLVWLTGDCSPFPSTWGQTLDQPAVVAEALAWLQSDVRRFVLAPHISLLPLTPDSISHINTFLSAIGSTIQFTSQTVAQQEFAPPTNNAVAFAGYGFPGY